MTDISKYKNVSLAKDTYHNLDRIRKVITPHITQSRSGTINSIEMKSKLAFILLPFCMNDLYYLPGSKYT